MKRFLSGPVLGGTIVFASLTLSLSACSDDKSSDPAAPPTTLNADLGGSNALVNPQVLTDEEARKKLKNLVQLVVEGKDFSTLEALLINAGLVDTVKNGQFTVFAPTDAAFAKLPKAVVDYLLADKEALTQVLLYHVVPGKLTAATVLASPEIETAAKEELKISLKDGKPFVNDSGIIKTDILANNGVIHVIDTVLVPPGFSLPESSKAEQAASPKVKLH